MHLFLAPECAPFAIAAMILVGLTVIEILSMLLGFSLSELIGKPHFEGHEGVIAGLLSWINIGGVPLLILIMLVLGIFAVTGFAIQTVADIAWTPLPAMIAAAPALLVTIPLVRGSTRTIGAPTASTTSWTPPSSSSAGSSPVPRRPVPSTRCASSPS